MRRLDWDWITDFCSSDLAHPLPGMARRAHQRALPAHATRRARRQDRKSVVEGKRVDLGGRRIIKKKETACGDWTGIGLQTFALPISPIRSRGWRGVLTSVHCQRTRPGAPDA